MSAACLRVALPVPLPRLFDYLPPDGQTAAAGDVGRRVRVPFGPRELAGVVVAVGPPETAAGLRRALAFADPAPLFHGELLDSLLWLARYTHAPPGEVLATALPAPLRAGEPLPDTHAWAWALTEAGATALAGLRRGTRPRRLAELLQAGPLDEDRLDRELDGWRPAARSLSRRRFAERVAVPAIAQTPAAQPGPLPNPGQQAAIEAIAAVEGFAAVLLEGITGSGKTEVYLHAIAQCLARGRQALVLVPEIGLTPQTLARFRARLGVPVHALHSNLADGERARVWAAAWSGQARVIVGTRSAVFTPLPDAGLIVIDEEHDGSYKQQDGIRYHARDFALVRGKALGVPVLLGSATPSLETLHNAGAGRYAHLRLRQRAGDASPPQVRILDVRKRPLQAGLAPETLETIGAALREGGQVLVFKNRRGYAPVLLCHDCGWSAQCPRCSTPLQGTPMTVHAGGGRLVCHHCGHRQARPPACPDCASLALQPQGIGTERLEELLAERFADWPVLRIDRGTTARRDGLARLLAELGQKPGILVGTQILAKGHDLPNLTRVVVVGVDEGLFSTDFRAGEKLAQLLVQVAGRAGRAQRPGQVWWQTHHPDHPLLHALIQGGYDGFARDELALRQAAGFPPFAHLALLRAEAQQAEAAGAFLQAARDILLEAGGPAAAPIDLHGPITAPMARRAGLYRMQLLLSCPHRPALHARLDAALPAIHALPQARRTRWSLDVDPVDLY
ncbi:primosomal protein N' [Pseudoxanthomonas broegbernensis]|uniref:Replication restart protein PriA n=1 Tax=Pseudoxanthomonas broegbernensis TaxID=83619 RepID=A0A7V8GNG9_9GAMM|nr:primosomal protein N' [Pseudoxanthomonas broegbernensis]KAF1687135.1 primosomal protein N' [Pseudoxanthomonas broegbernensis]MBB6065889.1 primosomal protein N' (replication factor Y) [Pseudoxanthomonas broegbernensis]